MKIISPYKDYYDSVMAYGTDDSIVYRRVVEREVIPSNVWAYGKDAIAYLNEMPKTLDWMYPHLTPVVLGVCGKVYPLWTDSRETIGEYGELSVTGLQDAQGVTAYIERNNKYRHYDREVECYLNAKLGFSKHTLEKFVREHAGRKIDYEIFQNINAPVFLLSHFVEDNRRYYSVLKNVSLKDCSFFRYMDAYAAYQELSMFVGGVLGVVDTAPTRVGGDAIAITSHGFDEHSFRTQAPGNKKANRELNRLRKRGLL